MPTRRRALALLPLGLLVLGACGGGDDLTLSPAGEAGRSTFRSNGCSSCHGANGGGGVGPAFTGLYGADVVLDDGTTVVADDAYLRESIADPGAKKVDGYRVPMPTNDLTDAEIDQVIAFIRELATDTTSTEAAAGREIARTNGCSACHGRDGEGGVAGPFVGLYGSDVELADGTTVVADDDYLREAIADPAATTVAGYQLTMPANDLADADIDRVIAYIKSLSTDSETS